MMEEMKQSNTAGLLRRHPWAKLMVPVVIVVIVLGYLAVRMMSTAQPITEARLATVTSGEQVEVALEVKDVKTTDLLVGYLLERRDDQSYRRTSKSISLRLRSDTKLVMGERNDIHPGAIVQAKGQITNKVMDSDRIVILTGYVTVDLSYEQDQPLRRAPTL